MTFSTADLGDWADLPFFSEDLPKLASSLAGTEILPPPAQTFAALEQTQATNTRVVILGQDPYPTPGHAHGLAFSAAPTTHPLPKSLHNIFKEMRDDIHTSPTSPDLHHWASQGVLLLNTALTVKPHTAGAHSKIGWSKLTKQVVQRLSDRPRAWLLWGKHAQGFGTDLGPEHLKLETPHPSPLSAYRGFFGSRPFSTVNQWLIDQGQQTIDWAGS